jgi:hypothetical protein
MADVSYEKAIEILKEKKGVSIGGPGGDKMLDHALYMLIEKSGKQVPKE